MKPLIYNGLLKPHRCNMPPKESSHGGFLCFYAVLCSKCTLQEEMQRRKTMGKTYNCSHSFSAKIICADCGGFYGPKVWNSTSQYRRTIWQCNGKLKHKCTTPHLDEDDIRERFIQAYNTLFADKENVIVNAKKQEQTFLIQQFIHALTKYDHPLTEWDESMWQMTVDTVTVQADGKLLFRFQDGTVVES